MIAGAARLELSGQDWWAQSVASYVQGGNDGTRIHLVEATARGCFRGSLSSRFELDPCAGVGLVFADSKGFGTGAGFQPISKSVTWPALEGAVLASGQLFGPFALRAAASIGIPLTRPDFVLQLQPSGGQIVLHRPSAVAGKAGIGIEARFP
jgi:hypothetical protein